MGKVGGSLKLKNTSNNNKIGKEKMNTSAKINSNTSTSIQMISKTPSQLAFEAAQQKKQKQKLPLLASKSHKEKVAEFNEYLGKLSEHHDIPRVGPG